MKTFSITEAARLIGVSTATVSRQLAPERAIRGRNARLSIDELARIAEGLHVDPEVLRARTRTIDFANGMPVEAERWAQTAIERGLAESLGVHVARIAAAGLAAGDSADEPIDLPEPWGAPADWEPLVREKQLDALLPPLDR
jgi:transcriptional regulator with XRE-family HTH domain